VNEEIIEPSVGFPFKIISDKPATIGPRARFVFVSLSEDYYSRESLERISHYFCTKYSDKDLKLDVRIHVDRRTNSSEQPDKNDAAPGTFESNRGFDANFLRQGDGALAGGGDNEVLIYVPDLDRPAETKRIVLKGKDPFAAFFYTGNPDSDFVAAAAKGDRTKFEFLLAQGVDINARDKYQNTALIEASILGDMKWVETLLKKGAKVDSKNEGGWTALICAASKGNNDIVELLLKKGADLEARTDEGMSALSRAIYDGKPDTVRLLLAKGAQVEFKDRWGDTPLFLAANRNPEIVRSLLERNADVHARNNDAETPLMIAFQEGSVNAMLDKGADVNAQDGSGNTALMDAILDYNPTKVRILLEHGADVSIENRRGETALRIAQQYSNKQEVIEMLKRSGAKQ
jgi:ankyrin repeat protein